MIISNVGYYDKIDVSFVFFIASLLIQIEFTFVLLVYIVCIVLKILRGDPIVILRWNPKWVSMQRFE